jgi:hypothetical protein
MRFSISWGSGGAPFAAHGQQQAMAAPPRARSRQAATAMQTIFLAHLFIFVSSVYGLILLLCRLSVTVLSREVVGLVNFGKKKSVHGIGRGGHYKTTTTSHLFVRGPLLRLCLGIGNE